jgi:hypothetical protein
MSTHCWFPSSGTAAVSPTPDATTWNLHVNSVSRPLNFVRGSSALATLAYNPDGADHIVDGNSMIAQFVSPILPPQAVAAQQIGWGARMLEAAASNNLFPMLRLTGWNAAGTTQLGVILAGTRQATEMATALTGACYIQAGSAVTFSEPWRLVAEWGCGGLPVNTATDTHNASIEFGEAFASGNMNLGQQGDTTAFPPSLLFSEDLRLSGPEACIITPVSPPVRGRPL